MKRDERYEKKVQQVRVDKDFYKALKTKADLEGRSMPEVSKDMARDLQEEIRDEVDNLLDNDNDRGSGRGGVDFL